ncbi:MAG: adenosylmethionine--8-amino-7-oxononanoate transaminase [Firmicutes bacterium]|nr:adenosylmethionine--8-amino-7-oxononanoate transaminase [Bacillota bacterium]
MNNLQKKDLKYIWHPCSQMKDYGELPPIVIEKGEGVFLYDTEGHSYLDAISSWWASLLGHNHKRIKGAINKQINKLEHIMMANFSHEPAIELAEKIVDKTPDRLEKVFFASDGASSVEVALKLSFQYFQEVGKPQKTKFASLSNSYHGDTLGALAVSDLGIYRDVFNPILCDTIQIEGPDCYRCQFGLNRENCQAECFKKLEETFDEYLEELASIIVEPIVQGAGGMMIYSPVYLKKLRQLCDKYDVLLIDDEIAMGMGRTGKLFACEHAGISPDIMTISKGITAGTLPLSLTVMSDKIYNAFYDDYTKGRSFLHSHTYSGNPVACAVACETLDIFEEENILEKNKEKSEILKAKIEEYLLDLPQVGDFRHIGILGAVELVKDTKRKEPFNWKDRVGFKIYKNALRNGLILRPLGDIIYFMPAYVINEEEIEFMVKTARKSIKEYFES